MPTLRLPALAGDCCGAVCYLKHFAEFGAGHGLQIRAIGVLGMCNEAALCVNYYYIIQETHIEITRFVHLPFFF
ncbi:MAG: hypothetical protein RLZZ500_1269 [Bacteroidota bacterium]